MKHEKEALAAYARVAADFPTEPSWVVTALAKMGEVHEQMGKPALAIEDYKKIVRLKGDPAWAASARQRIKLCEERIAELRETKKQEGVK
jgi:hypothetical protein